MKIVQINTFPYKATGNIMLGIHRLLTEEGHDSYVVWGRGRDAENDHEIVIKDDLGVKLHGAYTRLTDRTGFASKPATRKLLAKLDEIQPDIVHLHNIHGYYINIELLFNYIRSKSIRVVWTLHDCWPVTGHCAYFDMVGCEKWKTGCHDCEQKGTYPASKLLDSSAWNWDRKWQLFSGLDITIVTPCVWLKRIINQSFLREYPIKVLYNGIDLDVFKPSYTSEKRRKYCPDDKAMVLGVASEWTERKGLNDFIRLAEKAPDIQFVVVGLTEEQVKRMPNSIVAIERTSNVQELVELYSVADVFLNPTYEDNFPTTNIEALACGTPIVVYDTGGCPEAVEIGNKTANRIVGTVVKKKSSSNDDVDSLVACLRQAAEGKQSKIAYCRKAAKAFDMHMRLKEYTSIYEEQRTAIEMRI
ncbi:MAG: glycosyltransferase [Lachnospiraceae bacterium]|nr:glycosyltransferase [Lachnospiraceae bacterium]